MHVQSLRRFLYSPIVPPATYALCCIIFSLRMASFLASSFLPSSILYNVGPCFLSLAIRSCRLVFSSFALPMYNWRHSTLRSPTPQVRLHCPSTLGFSLIIHSFLLSSFPVPRRHRFSALMPILMPILSVFRRPLS